MNVHGMRALNVDEAIDLCPKDMTCYDNLSLIYFDREKYHE